MYRYDDANWQDKLTAYNNVEFAYDAIGNLKNDGTWTYTWQAGRHLRKMTKSGMTVEFRCDHNGLRTQKKVTEGDVVTTTNYYLHGKLVTHMTVGSDKLHFFYDAQSRPAKVSYDGTVYTYLHNLQGDIVGIVDGSGNLVVEYRYDAWGQLLSVSGSKKDTLGKLNPFRYRGYVYDEETELYYLRSRYYTPNKGRFMNADSRVFTKKSLILSISFPIVVIIQECIEIQTVSCCYQFIHYSWIDKEEKFLINGCMASVGNLLLRVKNTGMII